MKTEMIHPPGCGLDRNALREALASRGEAQQRLFRQARAVRERYFPSRRVEARSVIELANLCRQRCRFCGIGDTPRQRGYLLDLPRVMEIVAHVYARGRRVLLLQSGENGEQAFVDHVCRCVAGIRARHPEMTVILCLGNLERHQYRQLRQAGADRYILKFETSNADLYRRVKPADTLQRRLACLDDLVELGFDVGSGNIVGLPGQTLEDLVDDLLFLAGLDLFMVSTSVFIPGEGSVYRNEPMGNIDLALNLLALMRIFCPQALIPTTSALEKARPGGQLAGLNAGANTVTVHDGTPVEFKEKFPIYSASRFSPDEGLIAGIVEGAGLLFPQPAADLKEASCGAC